LQTLKENVKILEARKLDRINGLIRMFSISEERHRRVGHAISAADSLAPCGRGPG